MRLQQYIEDEWLITPTNTQLVERWVKDSNKCTYSNKDPYFSSLVAVCRSVSVFVCKEDASIQSRTRVLRANQHVTKGKLGERRMRKTGELEKETQIREIRGASYTKLVIQNTMKRSKQLHQLPNLEQERKAVKRYLTSFEARYQSKQIAATVEDYAHSLFEIDQDEISNVMIRSTGFDSTSYMCGEINYSSLRSIHVQIVRDELSARKVQFDDAWGIKKLVEALKEWELEKQREKIEIETGNKMPDESQLNYHSFSPLVIHSDACNV